MKYLAENKVNVDLIMSSDLMPDFTPQNKYTIMQNNITFYSNRFLDLSPFKFLENAGKKQEFYESKFNAYSLLTYS